ncbi:MAG TPA: hypothetical protein VF062_09235 [Candidatus Limnocylindrales bacterium]
MSRTPEQKAADEALTAAVEQALTAYGSEEQSYVLTEYVVLTAQTRYDEDGDAVTAVGIVYRDGDVPHHRALGLIDYAATRLRAAIAED